MFACKPLKRSKIDYVEERVQKRTSSMIQGSRKVFESMKVSVVHFSNKIIPLLFLFALKLLDGIWINRFSCGMGKLFA